MTRLETNPCAEVRVTLARSGRSKDAVVEPFMVTSWICSSKNLQRWLLLDVDTRGASQNLYLESLISSRPEFADIRAWTSEVLPTKASSLMKVIQISCSIKVGSAIRHFGPRYTCCDQSMCRHQHEGRQVRTGRDGTSGCRPSCGWKSWTASTQSGGYQGLEA